MAHQFGTAVLTNLWKGKRTPWQVIASDPAGGWRAPQQAAPVDQVSVDIEMGADVRTMSPLRVIGGGVLLGPLGAVAGALARKDVTRFALVLTFPSGVVVRLPFTRKDHHKAVKFLEAIVSKQGA